MFFISFYNCNNVGAITTIKDLFFNEPGYLYPILKKNARMDLVDYYNEGRMVDVKNDIGGNSRFLEVKPNYISTQVTSSTQVDLLLIEDKKDTIIVAVTTNELPAKDSKIVFFNTKWQRYVKSRLQAHGMEDFIAIPKGNKTKKETLFEAIDFPIISYSINPEDNTIIARQGLKDYMSLEDYKKIEPYLKDSITFVYKNGQFKIRK